LLFLGLFGLSSAWLLYAFTKMALNSIEILFIILFITIIAVVIVVSISSTFFSIRVVSKSVDLILIAMVAVAVQLLFRKNT